MLFEILSIAVVIVYIIAKLEERHFRAARGFMGEATEPQPTAAPAQPSPFLDLPGTEPVAPAWRSRVRYFGLNPAQLHDLRAFASSAPLPAWPEPLIVALRQLYQQGHAFGTTVADILANGNALPPGEALYFATISGANAPPQIFAFVDRAPSTATSTGPRHAKQAQGH